jgi:hypothetical protein
VRFTVRGRAGSGPADQKGSAVAHDGGGGGADAADPDGHLWEIAWNPGFPLDESGAVSISD